MEYVHKLTAKIKEQFNNVNETDDVQEMEERIKQVYNENVRENYRNIENFETVYDKKKKKKKKKEKVEGENNTNLQVQHAESSVVESFITTEK